MHGSDAAAKQPPTLFTIGHSNRSLDELIELLNEYKIRQLLDVRTLPDSRNQSMFNRTPFSLACNDEGIAYGWLGLELGGLRRPKGDSQHTALNSGLRSYADHMQSSLFKRGINQICQLALQTNTALMCAERDPNQCHRSMIADHMILKGWRIIHIINREDWQEHRLNPLARLDEQTLIYDQLTQEQLDFHF